jgi:hypothetical protein
MPCYPEERRSLRIMQKARSACVALTLQEMTIRGLRH